MQQWTVYEQSNRGENDLKLYQKQYTYLSINFTEVMVYTYIT